MSCHDSCPNLKTRLFYTFLAWKEGCQHLHWFAALRTGTCLILVPVAIYYHDSIPMFANFRRLLGLDTWTPLCTHLCDPVADPGLADASTEHWTEDTVRP